MKRIRKVTFVKAFHQKFASILRWDVRMASNLAKIRNKIPYSCSFKNILELFIVSRLEPDSAPEGYLSDET